MESIAVGVRAQSVAVKEDKLVADLSDGRSISVPRFTDDQIRLMFAKQPTSVEIGAILLVQRIKTAKMIFVAEATTRFRRLNATELMREPDLVQWPWRIEGKNLTPGLGRWWRECSLKTFLQQ